ncbi:MAG: DHA2 family efflux MFS transporter permease subunit [Candidatus Tectomicrobia bacterium]|nr:DHA2 family efflux MFS transporter permease subunit [Candidatus Tectomicrobia bacterium]
MVERVISLAQHPQYKWFVTASLMTGTVASAIAQTSINLALPKMMTDLRVDVDEIKWVLTGSMITMAIMTQTVGWLGNRLGNHRLYIMCLLFFITGSALCGLAWSANSLIFFRIFQAFGNGPMFPTAMTILYSTFPPRERGMALGIFMSSWTLGSTIGPTIGGYLVEHISWRSIFYLNLPAGILAIVLCLMILPRGQEESKKSLDLWGFLTMATCVVSFLLAVSQGQKEGWDSSYILTLFTLAVVFLLLFLARELTAKEPLVELRLFRNIGFTMASIVGTLSSMALMGSTFIIAIFLQNMLGYTPLQAGWLLVVPSLVMGVMGIVTGHLSDRFDNRSLIIFGQLCLAAVWYRFSSLSPLESTGFVWLLLCLQNFSTSWSMSPVTNVTLKVLPERDVRMGSGLSMLAMMMGGSFGVAMTGTIFTSRQLHHTVKLFRDEQLLSSTTQNFIRGLQHLFLRSGDSLDLARVRSLTVMRGHLIQEANLAAYHDLYLLGAFLSLLSVVPALFITQPQGEKKEEMAKGSLTPVISRVAAKA